MIKNDINDVRSILFNTLHALGDKENPIDLDRARTIGDIAKVLVDTARVEVDFVKHTGSNGSGFIPEADPGPGVHRLAHTPGPAAQKMVR
jgi:hypothetical protein